MHVSQHPHHRCEGAGWSPASNAGGNSGLTAGLASQSAFQAGPLAPMGADGIASCPRGNPMEQSGLGNTQTQNDPLTSALTQLVNALSQIVGAIASLLGSAGSPSQAAAPQPAQPFQPSSFLPVNDPNGDGDCCGSQQNASNGTDITTLLAQLMAGLQNMFGQLGNLLGQVAGAQNGTSAVQSPAQPPTANRFLLS